MVSYIKESQEFYEVVNTFPVLRDVLSRFHIGSNKIHEGETVTDFLDKNCYNEEEKNMLLKKLNNEINLFLNTTRAPLDLSEFTEPTIEAEEEEE